LTKNGRICAEQPALKVHVTVVDLGLAPPPPPPPPPPPRPTVVARAEMILVKSPSIEARPSALVLADGADGG
jgi:hypothetical protein